MKMGKLFMNISLTTALILVFGFGRINAFWWAGMALCCLGIFGMWTSYIDDYFLLVEVDER